jgi:hypothetical protein
MDGMTTPRSDRDALRDAMALIRVRTDAETGGLELRGAE